MARRWTPRRFIVQRRVRVALSAVLITVAVIAAFGLTARKSVALSVNGQTRTVNTYAYSVDALLRQAGVKVKTHDLVESTSDGQLHNHDVVTVRSAYQTTINIQGRQVPFWTTATSVDQLLGFFEANQRNAMKVTVDVKNVYNQLTGGLVINQKGPVTVVADGKSSVAPNGKLPAASILDSKGIVLGKEDRVSVEKDQEATVLRVKRVTHGQTTRSIPLPFGSRTVIDPNLAPGQTEIRQQGVNGEKQETVQVTYVDGQAESENVVKEETVSIPIDQVVAVGPEKQETQSDRGKQADGSKDKASDESKQDSNQSKSGDSGNGDKPSNPTT
ncbi:G5 domain-containing protein, partial [uncultured Bifidobacterium sp.]